MLLTLRCCFWNMSHLARSEFLLNMHLIHVNSQFVFYFSCKVTNMTSNFYFLNWKNCPFSGNFPCLLETFGRWSFFTQFGQCGSSIRFFLVCKVTNIAGSSNFPSCNEFSIHIFLSIKIHKYRMQFQFSLDAKVVWSHVFFSVSF